jgi:hypothetical protein
MVDAVGADDDDDDDVDDDDEEDDDDDDDDDDDGGDINDDYNNDDDGYGAPVGDTPPQGPKLVPELVQQQSRGCLDSGCLESSTTLPRQRPRS